MSNPYAQFDATIADADAAIAALDAPLEEAVAEFVAATKEWIVATYNDWVLREVQGNPSRATEYGKEGLGQMKRELAELVAELPALVDERIGNNAHWSHRPVERRVVTADSHAQGLYTSSRSTEGPLRLGLRSLLGPLGRLLVKHKFAKVDEDGSWRWAGTGGQVRYAYAFQESPKMAEALKKYTLLERRCAEAVDRRKDAEAKKLLAQANDLWESA